MRTRFREVDTLVANSRSRLDEPNNAGRNLQGVRFPMLGCDASVSLGTYGFIRRTLWAINSDSLNNLSQPLCSQLQNVSARQ